MNRALLNPFVSADLPKGIEEILDQDKATCLAFNRHGNLLAVGTASGYVALWDFDTRSVAATLRTSRDDGLSVSSVSFPAPRNGSLVLVSYSQGTVRLFDTLSAQLLSEVMFGVPIAQAVPHPKVAAVALVIPQNSHPLVVHLRRGVYTARKELFERVRDPRVVVSAPAAREQHGCLTAGRRDKPPERPKDSFGNRKFGSVPDGAACIKLSVLCTEDEFDKEGVPKETSLSRRKSPYCVAFTRAGDRILRGGPSGLIRTFALEAGKGRGADAQVPTATCMAVVCVQGKAAVRAIIFSRKNEKVLINSHDRCMRLFSREQVLKVGNESVKKQADGSSSSSAATKKGSGAVPAVTLIEPVTTFTEIVNKTQCRCACFSSDGEYVLGGMEGTEHKIHVWRAGDGHLELTLEGAREGVSQIAWHPLRGVITSVGLALGQVYVWAKNVTENWSAFATEFSELEANEEYSESETEFDKKEPQDEAAVMREREKAEAGTVDVESFAGAAWFSSDSEEEDTYFYMPAVPVADGRAEAPSVADELVRAKLQERGEGRAVGRAGVSGEVVGGGAGGRKRGAERKGPRKGGAKRARGARRRGGGGGESSGAERGRATDADEEFFGEVGPRRGAGSEVVDVDAVAGAVGGVADEEVQVVQTETVVDQGGRGG